ncbi:electron transport complex subunit RsxG [Pseudomonas abyssi]|jgi:electron transport complex protein RnfG|uniref:Ion-translocating oxidoreductase complex subunit G n=1 Tax=Pseudomonas abyssi TaxID=170540 RepID=A0A2A3MES5_9PSED|nr:electron transport complex subunit RsxG [Pseudomonas abyssi]MAD00274.1 electron transport complex subunit RsxG [Pseudomonadales bacterium]PBK03291.1 electron transport complex subunit RsxG [Pseudomonas abyssi]|tara:strand:- start:1818 stop:2456 length:639 start_codon:yes stop_codon:yes gene_type:complete
MDTPTTTSRSILRNSVILGLFAVATVGMIAVTQQGTAERISEAQRRVQLSALNEIVPHDQHDNDLLTDSFTVQDRQHLSLSAPAEAYRARQGDRVSAVILPVVAPDGYSGRIDLLVGIRADGSIAGVRSVSHRETPGLGDKIDAGKSQWILSFNGKSLSMPIPDQWAVKKDGGQFDQFTGATITPRAVVKAVYQALNYFDEHRAALLQLDED